MSVEIERFCKTTRWFHWTFVTCFLLLAASGGALALRESLGLSPDHVGWLVSFHVHVAAALIGLPLLVWGSGQTRELTRDLHELLRWSRADVDWLRLQPKAALGTAALPPAGKLNAGQKVNGLATAGLTLGFLASGIVLWLRPGSLAAWFVHLSLFAAWIPLFIGHLSLALVIPSTRPALRGMLTGRVPEAWAREHHAAWLADGS